MGLEVFGFWQSKRNHNEPCRLPEARLKGGKLKHKANPVLRWLAGTAAVEVDGLGRGIPK